MDFSNLEAVIMDMDGVLWRGDTPLPGMRDFVAFLRELGLPFALATNNSSRLPTDYVAKLKRLGIDAMQPEQIVTSGTATAAYLRANYPPQTRVHVLGMDGLRAMLREAGLHVVDEGESDPDVAVVVAGIDFNLSYAAASRAALLIRGGAAFIGTNPDKTFPTPEGLVPGAGSLLALLEAATDVPPLVIGKPETAMFGAALEQLGSSAARTLMIGDRLNTDILGAQAAGMCTALVLTGVTTRDELKQSDVQPDGVYEDLPHLQRDWQASR